MKKVVCPKCKSNNIYFYVDTTAKFDVNPDGSVGDVILNEDGINCIKECVFTEPEHMHIRCRDCNSVFHVEYSDDGKWKYKIGSEI